MTPKLKLFASYLTSVSHTCNIGKSYNFSFVAGTLLITHAHQRCSDDIEHSDATGRGESREAEIAGEKDGLLAPDLW